MKLLLLFLPVLAFGQVQRSLVTSMYFPWSVGPVQNGDTWIFSGWSPPTDGGLFNGGNVYGTCNDCQAFGSAWDDVVVFKLAGYDQNNPSAASVTLVNSMTGIGAINSGPPGCATGKVYKSRAIWSDGGKLYLNILCNDGATAIGYSSGILLSPDKGVHWCNYAHYVAAGNTCTATNWNANGDPMAGTSTSDWQWTPAGANGYDHSGKMNALSVVQIAQDGAAPPTLPGGLSNTFHYFVSNTATTDPVRNLYLHRYTGDPMLPASWTHWNAGTWDANAANATSISLPAWTSQTNFAQSVFFSPKFKQFFMVVDGGCPVMCNFPMAVSTDLANWTQLPALPASAVVQPINQQQQFSTPILATMQDLGSRGIRISISANGAADGGSTAWDYTLGFAVMDFQPPNVSAGVAVGR